MYYQIVVRSEVYLNVFEFCFFFFVFFYRVLILQCKFRRTRDGKGDTSFFIDINEYAHDANGVMNILLKLIYFTGNRVNYWKKNYVDKQVTFIETLIFRLNKYIFQFFFFQSQKGRLPEIIFLQADNSAREKKIYLLCDFVNCLWN